MYGLTKVNARTECAAMVAAIDSKIHETFRPVLSITKPNNGLAMAEIKYTNESTEFACSAV